MARRWMRGALAALAAASLALGATASAPPAAPTWTPDPDSQFLLDLQIRQRSLGDGVRAYPVPGGTCVILGDLVTALDLPIAIDLKARTASGWAFREENRIAVDRGAGTVRVGATLEPLGADAIRDAPEGWCVDTAVAARWLSLAIEPRTDASLLLLDSKDKLPVELAAERRERAARLTRASVDLGSLPQVRLPYRMWRTPSVDVMVDAGVTYAAGSGARIDHRASILAAGEALQLSYQARIGTDQRGLPTNIRLQAFRSDPDAGLLGPLRATHVAVGDVEGLGSPLAVSSASGRGAVITNRPLFKATAFDRTQFSGELPPGWDAELYRNGELIAFAAGRSDGRYAFDDVALNVGENRFDIVTYGPQGQVKRRSEAVMVGPDAVPPGKTTYWAGVVDPGRDLVNFRSVPRSGDRMRGWRATAAVEHGIDQRTSVAALVQTLSVNDERVTYVEGALRRSIGPALTEIAAARDDRGGMAFRGQALAKLGPAHVSWTSFVARNFHARPDGLGNSAEHRLGVDVPLKLSEAMVLPLHADVRLAERRDGGKSLELGGRTGLTISRFNLAALVRYREDRAADGTPTRRDADLGLIGSGRIGPVRVRGTTEFEVAPHKRLRRAELSGYYSRGGGADWEGALAYEAGGRRVRARVSHIRRFDQLALAGTLEAASDGSVAAGINLAFSIDRGRNGWRLSRRSLAGTGSVRAQVFRDENGNGIRDQGEKAEKGAVLTAGTRPGDGATDREGWASVAGLDNYRAVAIGVDTSSLSDPNLVPVRPAQLIVPRPGVSAEVLIPLSGGGSIEGVLAKDGGGAFEGLELELVDAGGKVVATATSDFDGYFLFDRVVPGAYRLRLTERSQAAARATDAVLRARVELAPEQAIARLGTIVVGAAPTPAPAEPTKVAVNQKVVSGDLALTE